jgi:hypothetical protein
MQWLLDAMAGKKKKFLLQEQKKKGYQKKDVHSFPWSQHEKFL